MRLLRSLFDKHVRSTTIVDGVDLIRRLQTYIANGYLKSTTYLCTFDITDLYTMLPQEESLDILTEFLLQYGYQKIRGVPIDAIRKLGRLVLTENVFIYKKKFYRQVIGGAMDTSNESLDKINEMLDLANGLHPNIKLVRQVGSSVSFLDLLIKNKNGILDTLVYYKEATESYIVPFKSDHPKHVFRNTINTALLRAVRYCSTLSAFEDERRSIELILLFILS
ncbi:unnamed protein product [Adineta ricciae]|uniref:Helix-turn-helix domain-containing protein n=1 Tax=Adineta ricciae TaxID=249248 RepID=A0A815S9S8_ADIRI|nr:unnamed protein product [Adineta ricciae]CAF1625955.1 unnamed protein product [Adineta ricciae]